MICIDYSFSALENFLEHIGFILYDHWDSKKEQRHYSDKQKKISSLSEVINKHLQPDLDYVSLEAEWHTIINSLNPKDYVHKRN